MTAQAALWTGTGASLASAVAAGFMEWRRGRRRNFEAVGWVPWRGIQVTAFFAALAFAMLALRS